MSFDHPEVIGQAVLRDYPLRLWARQQEHVDALLREFTLITTGMRSGQSEIEVPARLVELAEMFQMRFGPLLAMIQRERQEALDAGLDRIDSRVPLLQDIPQLLESVRETMSAVDEYCASGDLLTLARPADIIELERWTMGEVLAQYHGEEPTPWPGPW